MNRLNELNIGEEARIISINSTSESKLIAMGIIPGEIIKLIRIAPMGDPYEFLIKNYSLSLRKSLCQKVEVTPLE